MTFIVLEDTSNNRIWTFLLDDHEQIVEFHYDDLDQDGYVGAIYVGRVEQVKKNINSAFVRISDQEKVFLSMEGVTEFLWTSKIGQGKQPVQGDALLVQIEKQAHKTKQAKATAHITLAGKYCILTTDKAGVYVSSKIKDDQLRLQLKHALKPYTQNRYGCILRTNSQEATTQQMIGEYEELIAQYEAIVDKRAFKQIYQCVYKPEPTYLNRLRDLPLKAITSIITSTEQLKSDLQGLNTEVDPMTIKVMENPMLTYSLKEKFEKLKHPKVWLKSGASIIIEPTEALTVIDVNTEKSLSRKNIEETIVMTNLEAAKEIFKQIKARNISGIILIDFIDMLNKKDNKQLLKVLHQLSLADPMKVTVHGITTLGLVEMTRKKVEKSIYEVEL